MLTQQVQCQVDVDGAPSRILWAPNEPVVELSVGKEHNSGASFLVRMPTILIAGILDMLMA
jgi:hypothetical protein